MGKAEKEGTTQAKEGMAGPKPVVQVHPLPSGTSLPHSVADTARGARAQSTGWVLPCRREVCKVPPHWSPGTPSQVLFICLKYSPPLGLA